MPRTPTEDTLNNRRIFSAADVLLRAIESTRGFDSLVLLADGRRRPGTGAGVAGAGVLAPDAFTFNEFIEAMSLLIRMGLVPARRPARCPA